MLLAVLAPLAFVGSKVPVRRELNLSVALRHVIQVDLIIVDRLVGIFSVDGLDDELALKLKKHMIRRHWTCWFLQVIAWAGRGGCRRRGRKGGHRIVLTVE